MAPEVRRYMNLGELSAEAAALVAEWARESVARRGAFTLALSGGRSPQKLYERLSRSPYDVAIPWSQVHFFWGDERCVPPNDPASNFGMAARCLLCRLAPPPNHVHRPPAEVSPPDRAARLWEDDLRAFFGESGGFPRFDLVLLGVGEDGHTASLFPDSPALAEQSRWTAAVDGNRGKPPLPRLTLTLPVLNCARRVMFLVSGSGKAEVVRAILDDPEGAGRQYPAARVSAEERLIWLLDGGLL